MIVAGYDVMIDWAELKALPAPLNDTRISRGRLMNILLALECIGPLEYKLINKSMTNILF
jgi:hypothetical protein